MTKIKWNLIIVKLNRGQIEYPISNIHIYNFCWASKILNYTETFTISDFFIMTFYYNNITAHRRALTF